MTCQNSRMASELGFYPRHSCSSASSTLLMARLSGWLALLVRSDTARGQALRGHAGAGHRRGPLSAVGRDLASG